MMDIMENIKRSQFLVSLLLILLITNELASASPQRHNDRPAIISSTTKPTVTKTLASTTTKRTVATTPTTTTPKTSNIVADRSYKAIPSNIDHDRSSSCPSHLVTQDSSHEALCSSKEDNINLPCDHREYWPEQTTASTRCGIFWKDANAKSHSNDDNEHGDDDSKIQKRICLNGVWIKPVRSYSVDCKPLCGFGDNYENVEGHGGNILKRVVKSPSPWHVGLYREEVLGSNEYRYTCGGTLISERAILTAGQCVTLPEQNVERRPEHIKVALGNFKQMLGANQTRKLYNIEKIVLHNSYNPSYYESDLAIIWLEDNVKTTVYIHPICLPRSHETVKAGELAKTVVYRDGTGKDGHLTVIDSETCKQSSTSLKSIVKPVNFCAEGKNDPDVCTPQAAGGGLAVPRKNKHSQNTHNRTWFLEGIKSGVSNNDCQNPRPIVFTRISSFIPWIDFELSREPPIYLKVTTTAATSTTTNSHTTKRPQTQPPSTTGRNSYQTSPSYSESGPVRRPSKPMSATSTVKYPVFEESDAEIIVPSSNEQRKYHNQNHNNNNNNNNHGFTSNTDNMYRPKEKEVEWDAENISLFERKTKTTTTTTTERNEQYENYNDNERQNSYNHNPNNNNRASSKSTSKHTTVPPVRDSYESPHVYHHVQLDDTDLRSPIVNNQNERPVNHNQNPNYPNQRKPQNQNRNPDSDYRPSQRQNQNQNINSEQSENEQGQHENSRRPSYNSEREDRDPVRPLRRPQQQQQQQTYSPPRSEEEADFAGIGSMNKPKKPIKFASAEDREESLVFPSVRPIRKNFHCPPPLVTSEGVRLSCSHADREDKDECDEGGWDGSKATLECKKHYTHAFSQSRVVRNCTEHEIWLPDTSFGCKLECGISSRPKVSAYIVNGANSDRVSWPWHATIFKRNHNDDDDEDSYSYYCGGTLITQSAILTAAHCVTKPRTAIVDDISEFKIVLAAVSSNYSLNRRDNHHRKYSVSNISIPEYYNPVKFESDIAVIQLKHDAELSDYIKPICWPESNEDNKQKEQNHLVTGSVGFTVGFGTDENRQLPSQLKETSIPYVNPKTCGEALDRYPSVTQFCGGHRNGTSVCNGDSGGGIFFLDESNKYQKRFLLQGIISNGDHDKESKIFDSAKLIATARHKK